MVMGEGGWENLDVMLGADVEHGVYAVVVALREERVCELARCGALRRVGIVRASI